MYELKQVGDRTFYIDCPSRMGIYRFAGNDVCMIDSGNDKDAAKKALNHITAQNLTLRAVINTHIHADHIGGNKLLTDRTGCKILYNGIDGQFISSTIFNPSLLYGGHPMSQILGNKFFIADGTTPEKLTADNIPTGLTFTSLDGHAPSNTGYRTPDGVWFLGDCLTGAHIIEKYHVSYIYDVKMYIESLEKVTTLDGSLFIPSHSDPVTDIKPLAKINLDKVYEICELIKALCLSPTCFDDILQGVFNHFELKMDISQSILVGATIRSYLSYLSDKGELLYITDNNKLYWKAN